MALPLLVLQQDLKYQWRDVADSSTFSTQYCWPILRIHRFCRQKSCVCVCVDLCTHTHARTHTHTHPHTHTHTHTHTLFTTTLCFEISSAHLRSNKDLEGREEKNYCWGTTARSVRFVYCPKIIMNVVFYIFMCICIYFHLYYHNLNIYLLLWFIFPQKHSKISKYGHKETTFKNNFCRLDVTLL